MTHRKPCRTLETRRSRAVTQTRRTPGGAAGAPATSPHRKLILSNHGNEVKDRRSGRDTQLVVQ